MASLISSQKGGTEHFIVSHESKGYFLVGCLRKSFTVFVGIITVPTLLDLAEGSRGRDGLVSWFGSNVKPSTLLGSLTLFSSVLVACLCAPFGILVDSTPYRKTFLVACEVTTGITAMSISLLAYNDMWEAGSLILVLGGLFYYGGLVCATAYLPEMSKSEHEVNHIQSYTALGGLMTAILYLGVCLKYGDHVGSLNYNNSGIQGAALGVPLRGQHEEAKDYHRLRATCLMGGLLCCVLQFASALSALVYLQPRGPPRSPPDGIQAIIAAFSQSRKALKDVKRCFPHTKLFLEGAAASEAALNTWPLVARAISNGPLEMSQDQVSHSLVFGLFTTVATLMLWVRIAQRHSLHTSLAALLAGVAFVWMASAALLSRPSRQWAAFPLSAAMGCVYMGALAQSRALYFSLLIPGGREAEFSGIYFFCTNIVGWVPFALFLLLHRYGVNLAALATATSVVYGIWSMRQVDVTYGKAAVASTLEARRYTEEFVKSVVVWGTEDDDANGFDMSAMKSFSVSGVETGMMRPMSMRWLMRSSSRHYYSDLPRTGRWEGGEEEEELRDESEDLERSSATRLGKAESFRRPNPHWVDGTSSMWSGGRYGAEPGVTGAEFKTASVRSAGIKGPAAESSGAKIRTGTFSKNGFQDERGARMKIRSQKQGFPTHDRGEKNNSWNQRDGVQRPPNKKQRDIVVGSSKKKQLMSNWVSKSTRWGSGTVSYAEKPEEGVVEEVLEGEEGKNNWWLRGLGGLVSTNSYSIEIPKGEEDEEEEEDKTTGTSAMGSPHADGSSSANGGRRGPRGYVGGNVLSGKLGTITAFRVSGGGDPNSKSVANVVEEMVEPGASLLSSTSASSVREASGVSGGGGGRGGVVTGGVGAGGGMMSGRLPGLVTSMGGRRRSMTSGGVNADMKPTRPTEMVMEVAPETSSSSSSSSSGSGGGVLAKMGGVGRRLSWVLGSMAGGGEMGRDSSGIPERGRNIVGGEALLAEDSRETERVPSQQAGVLQGVVGAGGGSEEPQEGKSWEGTRRPPPHSTSFGTAPGLMGAKLAAGMVVHPDNGSGGDEAQDEEEDEKTQERDQEQEEEEEEEEEKEEEKEGVRGMVTSQKN